MKIIDAFPTLAKLLRWLFLSHRLSEIFDIQLDDTKVSGDVPIYTGLGLNSR